jgi:hypothetical protein
MSVLMVLPKPRGDEGVSGARDKEDMIARYFVDTLVCCFFRKYCSCEYKSAASNST